MLIHPTKLLKLTPLRERLRSISRGKIKVKISHLFKKQSFQKKAIVLACLLLVSCGFQRSPLPHFPLSMTPLALDIVSPYDVLSKKLQNRFKRQGISIRIGYLEDHYVLHIKENPIKERILTIATNTRIRQVELNYSIQYSLTSPVHETIIEPRTIEIIRIHNENLDNLLGTHHDRVLLEEEMKNEVINLLLYQMNSQSAQNAITNYLHAEYYEN
jgi:outer membrane lipopolysaccharide assembly protein LptE/RlpB